MNLIENMIPCGLTAFNALSIKSPDFLRYLQSLVKMAQITGCLRDENTTGLRCLNLQISILLSEFWLLTFSNNTYVRQV